MKTNENLKAQINLKAGHIGKPVGAFANGTKRPAILLGVSLPQQDLSVPAVHSDSAGSKISSPQSQKRTAEVLAFKQFSRCITERITPA